jgi:adenine-specific DNA methylase
MDTLQKALREIYVKGTDSDTAVKKYGLTEDDLVYFFLDGDLSNITDGKLREALAKKLMTFRGERG